MKRLASELIRLILFIAYIIVVIALFGSFLLPQDGIRMLDSVQPISFTGKVSAEGDAMQDMESMDWHERNVSSVIAIGSFDHEITNGDSLILWPRNLRIKIYVNGIERVSTGQRDEFPSFIEYAGNSYKIFYIGDVSTNDEIRLEIKKAYPSCRINVIDCFFDNLYVGEAADLYHSIVSHEMLHLLIGLSLITIGVLVLLASFLQQFAQFQHMRQIHYLGWFCVVGGITYTYDSSYEFIDLLFPYPILNTLVDLCSIPVLLIFFLLYITNMVQSRQAKLFMKSITCFFTILEMIPILLQLFGIQDMHVIQDQYVFLGCLIVFFSCGAVIYEMIWHKNQEMQKVLIASLPFIISLCFKTINVVLEKGVERTYIRIGILISCLLLLHNTLNYIKQTMELIEQEQQMKQELQNAQVAIMLSQIHPHFLYNALNTVQHICKKDGALAAEALDHFSKYLRGNMDSLTTDKPIPFEQELDHVKHYLYIQKLRFGNRICVEYDLEITEFCIPTLTLQPIVENAIRHGITKQAPGGIVKIATKEVQNEIWIIVTDNGVGMEMDDYHKGNRTHIGMENVKKRLALQSNGTLVINSKKGVGTEVIIQLKGARCKNDKSNGC